MTYRDHREHQHRLLEALERVPTNMRETFVRACEALASIIANVDQGSNGGTA